MSLILPVPIIWEPGYIGSLTDIRRARLCFSYSPKEVKHPCSRRTPVCGCVSAEHVCWGSGSCQAGISVWGWLWTTFRGFTLEKTGATIMKQGFHLLVKELCQLWCFICDFTVILKACFLAVVTKWAGVRVRFWALNPTSDQISNLLSGLTGCSLPPERRDIFSILGSVFSKNEQNKHQQLWLIPSRSTL